jgi:hypothetical protein
VIALKYTDAMPTPLSYPTRGLLAGLAVIIGLQCLAASDPISVKAIAEVQQSNPGPGQESPKVIPADRVVSGDTVLYTLEVRNTAPTSAP